MTGNFLPDVVLDDAVQAHNENRIKTAQERYTTQVGRAHAGLVKLARKAAAPHDDSADANNAAADLLERFADSVEANGDNIVAGMTASSAGSATQAAQVHELEGRVNDAQRELAEARQAQENLQRSALRASNLQVDLDQRDREVARLKRELAASQAEAQELRQNADRPNPLKARVDQLETENTALKKENTELKNNLEQANAAKDELQKELNAAQAPAAPVAASAPVAEPQAKPDDQSGEAAGGGTMIGGIKGEEHEPRQRRGLRDRIPGHRRNQGEEA